MLTRHERCVLAAHAGSIGLHVNEPLRLRSCWRGAQMERALPSSWRFPAEGLCGTKAVNPT